MSKQSIARVIKPSRFSFSDTLDSAFNVFGSFFVTRGTTAEDRELSRAANDAAQR